MSNVYAEIIHSMGVIAKRLRENEPELAQYVTESIVNIAEAGRVNRLDLFHLLTPLLDVRTLDYSTQESNVKYAVADINAVYRVMDMAAAFGDISTPLVYDNREIPGLEGYNYPVLKTDSDKVAEVKRFKQKPSVQPYRARKEA